LIKLDKEGHPILIKEEIHQKEKEITNINAPNVNTHNFIKHALKNLNIYINSNIVLVGDFNTPISPIDRSFKEKTNKEILDLNHTRSNGPR
jgi:hypothetical protein